MGPTPTQPNLPKLSDSLQTSLQPHTTEKSRQAFRTMPFRKTFTPILLAALSTAAAAHPSSPEESQIRIETDSQDARIEFCLAKEDCKFIRFSGLIPDKIINKETRKQNNKENRRGNLIQQINDQIFGLLGF